MDGNNHAMNYNELAQQAFDLDLQIKKQQYELKQIKEQLKCMVDNNKIDGAISQDTDNGYKVTVKRNMNAKLDKKALDKYIDSGYTLPEGVISYQPTISKPILKKKIEQQSDDLSVLASFIETNYTETVTISKKED